MEKVILSIIIPAFNASNHIYGCLQSIFFCKNVTFANFEVIVVDDGSIDNTVSVVKDFLFNNNNNCRLIESEHVGVQEARRIGANNARGDILFFLDSDDKVSVDFVDKIISFYKNHNFDVLIINAEYELPGSSKKYKLLDDRTFSIMTKQSPLYEALLFGKAGFNCCHVYSKNVINYLTSIRLEELSYTEDLNIYIEVCLNHSFLFCFLNEILYKYVKQYKNKSSVVTLDKINSAVYVIKKRFSLYKQMAKSSTAISDFSRANIDVLLDWIYAISISNNLTKTEKNNILRSIKEDKDIITIVKNAKKISFVLRIKKLLFWDMTLLLNSKKEQK